MVIQTPDEFICPASSIFDNAQTRAAIDAAAADPPDAAALRRATVAVLAAAMKAGRTAIAQGFEAAPFTARPTTRAYSYLTDQIVHEVLYVATKYLHPLPNPTEGERL